MLRPEDVWHPRIGAPLGNRNRLKHGYHTRECKQLRRYIAQWRRETKALMAQAQRELARRKLPTEHVVATTEPMENSPLLAHQAGLVALPVALLFRLPLVMQLLAARHAKFAFGDAFGREIRRVAAWPLPQ